MSIRQMAKCMAPVPGQPGKSWPVRLECVEYDNGNKKYRLDYYAIVGAKKTRTRRGLPCNTDAEALALWTTMMEEGDIYKLHGAQDEHMQTTPPHELEGLAEWYLREYSIRKGMSARTVEMYTREVNKFIRWAGEHGYAGISELAGVRTWPGDYQGFLAGNYSPVTVNNEMDHIRAWFRACYQEEKIAAMPFRGWPRKMKVRERYIHIYTPDEVKYILSAELHPWYRGTIHFLAGVGCRPSDAAGLKWHDVDMVNRVAGWIQEKTGQRVEIKLMGSAWAAVTDAATKKQGDYVFHVRGKKINTGNMCRWYLRWAKADGVGGTLKSFRSTMVTTLLSAGADPEDVGRITGHRSPEIYAYYKRSADRSENLLRGAVAQIQGIDTNN